MPAHRVFVLATTSLEGDFPRDWGYKHSDRFFFDTEATSGADLLAELKQRPEYEASISPASMRLEEEYLVQVEMSSVEDLHTGEEGLLEIGEQLHLSLVDVLPEAHDLYVRLLLSPKGLVGPNNPFRTIAVAETVLPLANCYLGDRRRAFMVEAACVATMGQLRQTVCDEFDVLPEEHFMLLVYVPQGERWHVQQARWHAVIDDSDPMPTVSRSLVNGEYLHVQLVRQGTPAASTASVKASMSDAVSSSSSSNSSSERSATGIHPQELGQPMQMAHDDAG